MYLNEFVTRNPDTINFIVPVSSEIIKYEIIVTHDVEKKLVCHISIDGVKEGMRTSNSTGRLRLTSFNNDLLAFAPTALSDDSAVTADAGVVERVGRIQLRCFADWEKTSTPLVDGDEYTDKMRSGQAMVAQHNLPSERLALTERDKEKLRDFSTVSGGKLPDAHLDKVLQNWALSRFSVKGPPFIINIRYASANNYALQHVLPQSLFPMLKMTLEQYSTGFKELRRQQYMAQDAAAQLTPATAEAAEEPAKKKARVADATTE